MTPVQTVLRFEGARLPPLTSVTAEFPVGLHVVLGTPADGTAELVAASAGLSRLRRGSIEIGGKRLGPEVRRRIGAVLASEELGPGSVARAVERALKMRGDAASAEQVLRDWRLEAWSGRAARSLTERERRRVALAVTLSLRDPALVCVFEPFECAGGEEVARMERALDTAARSSVVLCATASPRVAARLGGTCRALFQGTLGAAVDVETAAVGPLAPRRELGISTSDARALARALATEPFVERVSFDERRAPGELTVAGGDVDAVSLAVVRHSVESGVRIYAIGSRWPDLEELRAAEAGVARAAYEHAYRQAWQQRNYAVAPAAPATPGVTP